jgi:hypothetical protein
MTARIKALTFEQELQLPKFRERWADLRLGVRPTDRGAAEDAVKVAYESAGLDPPKRIRWTGGPADLARQRVELDDACLGRNVKAHILDAVRSSVVTRVETCTSALVRSAVFHGVRSPIAEQVGMAVNVAVHEAVSQIRPNWRRRIGRRLAKLGGMRTAPDEDWRLYAAGFGTHDLGWLGVQECLREVCGLTEETRPLEGLWRLAGAVGWVLPHQRECWLAERPSRLAIDQQGRLHSKDGPALSYPDGWGIYAWKGIRLQPWMIENPGAIGPRAINRERDPRVRRCLIEILTPERYIALGEAVPVSRDETGTLWRRHWARQVWAAVEVVNGTPEPDGTLKRYYLQVPPEMRSAREAVAWTYGLTEQQYRRLLHRT